MAVAVAGLGSLAAPAAAAGPQLELSDGALAARQLLVGQDLHVALRDGSAGADYELRLLDEDGDPVASVWGKADAAGNLGPVLLWSRTGVIGCDCGGPAADTDEHTFLTFGAAELHLDGLHFEVQALSLSGVEVARTGLPIRAANREITYFSDAAGCPRTYLEASEPLYLSVLHPARAEVTRQLFLAASQPWPVGEPIVDVRGAGQTVTLPPTGDLLTFAVAGWPLVGGGSRATFFDGLVRQGLVSHPWRLPGDGVMARPSKFPEGNGGIVITMDGCVPAVGGGPRP